MDEDQVKHYQLLDQLQQLVRKLPTKTQQRLPYDLLANLASSLKDSTIFAIVNDLEEIQHLTEKNLFAKRQKFCNSQKSVKQEMKKSHIEAMQTCKRHNMSILKKQQETEYSQLEKRLQEEMAQFECKLLSEIDQNVLVQQTTLKSAGVSGFFITKEPSDVKLQMIILELIKSIGSQKKQTM